MISFGEVFGFFLFPFLLVGFYYSWRQRREMARAELEALSFYPTAEPAPSKWLRKLRPAERTYLRYLLKYLRPIYPMISWVIFASLSLPMFNAAIAHQTAGENGSAFVWFRYLLAATGMISTTCGILGIMAAGLVVSSLRLGSMAQFFRTRPLEMRFQFWTQVLSTLGFLLAAILTGAAASFALLYLLHGPVWRQLPAAFPRYQALLATSAPRVFISLCTTVVLVFSGFVSLSTLPTKRLGSNRNSVITMLAAGITSVLAFSALNTLGLLRIPRQLFFYAHLGPPPPYAFALFPILLSAGLLLLARFFVTRLEV